MDSHRVKIIQSTKCTYPIEGENSTQHTGRTGLLIGKGKKKLLIPQSGWTLKVRDPLEGEASPKGQES